LIAVWAPFLSLSEAGVSRQISLLDATFALSDGILTPFAALLIGATVALPLGRAAAHIYVLAPIRFGIGAPPGAAEAFRWAENMRPWAMAEIFMIGVGVAMVKIASIASITMGPAMWALGGAVAVLAFENMSLCRETVWRAIDEGRT